MRALRPVEPLEEVAWRNTCFFSSPIGAPESEQRKHADGLLESLVQPAIGELDSKMGVTRADKLPSSPITVDVYDHVRCSRLLIADLSFHRPNVLQEVGLRQGTGKPLVLISRTEDPIPSNLQDVRIVLVDTRRVWDFLSTLEARRAELTAYARWALSDDYRPHIP